MAAGSTGGGDFRLPVRLHRPQRYDPAGRQVMRPAAVESRLGTSYAAVSGIIDS